MEHVVSFSGGKDSTAMLLMMIEKEMPITDIIFCDTGLEFDEMYEHIAKVESYTNKKITVLKAEKSFEYLLGDHIKRNGSIGYGWPDFRNRWCTQILKKSVIRKYLNTKGYVIEYHGIAVDEKHRAEKNNENKRDIKYPLIDWGITEKQALEFCYSKGFDWGGLYEIFDRVSCWCCPLSKIGELRNLYKHYPLKWTELIEIDKKSFRKFRSDYTVEQLTERFKKEESIRGLSQN